MAYVELGQDNGGILLNLGEGGFAVQSALALTSREFPQLRFQVPALRGWLTASGRIVWMSDSKKEAGIQFTQLPGEARIEIQKWVLGEAASDERKDRKPVAPARPAVPAESAQPQRGMFDAPPRRDETHHHSPPQDLRTNARDPEPASAMQREPAGVAFAEAPPRDFHFTDYSMFAAVPQKEEVWVEPASRRVGWRAALLTVLLAALFFALGATVGRATVDRWLSYLGEWASSRYTAPVIKVTPPAPPAELGGRENSEKEGQKSSPATDEEQTTQNNGNDGDTSAPTNSVSAGGSEGKRQADAVTPAGVPKAGSGDTGVARSGRGAKGAIDTASRERRYAESAPSNTGSGPSILVNAPNPGSPPFYVNLPAEAVSASRTIAISARRSLEILPRGAGASGTERVIVGKLIAHSEPFYPADARSHGIEGSVELRARVGRTGQVVGVTPVSGPSPLFSAAAAAVREWRYEPTFVNGDPAETLADITIVFRLH